MATEQESEQKKASEDAPPEVGYEVLVRFRVQAIDSLSKEPKAIADVLHSKGFISDEIVEQIVDIPETKTNNARKLFNAVLAVIKNFPHRYVDFISILQENTLLYGDLLELLGETHLKEDESTSEQISPSLPHSQTSPRIEQKGATPPTIKISPEVSAALKTRVGELEEKFNKLASRTFDYLDDHSISINKFEGKVACMGVSLRASTIDFLEDCFDKLDPRAHIARLWRKLNNLWDFLNFEFLEHVTKTFIPEDDPLRKDMEVYTKEINDFSTMTKVCEFFSVWPFRLKKPEEAKVKKVVLKVERSWEDCTLLDIKDASDTLAKQFFLPRPFLLIRDVDEGCVSILWYVPPSVATLLEKGVTEVKPGFFSTNGFQSITIDDVQVYPHPPMRQYSQYLQGLYETKLQTPTSSKPLTKSANKFLMPFKLANIEKKEVGKFYRDEFTKRSLRGDKDDVRFIKSPIDLDSLGSLPDGSPARLILVEGAPGVGKTTFSHKVCGMWGRKEVLKNISTLALFPLRDHGLKGVTDLRELLAHSKPGAESLVEEMEANKGEGMAFWLDGWDEISSSLDGHSSVYERLVSGELLPKATVIVSSRPWATSFIKKQLDKQPSQHIEIVASVQYQMEYLIDLDKQAPPSKSPSPFAQVLEYLEKTPAIKAHMHTPLATKITLEVFHQSQETGSPLPTTVTNLYAAYIALCIHNFLSNHPSFGSKFWKSNDFKDLPEIVYLQLSHLCRFAYDGLLDGQRLVFPDIPKYLTLQTLGLMQTQAPLYASDESAVLSYHYNHLTVQEFLTAFIIVQLKPTQEEMIENFERLVTDGHFVMVMKFISGLTESKYIPRDVMRRILQSDKDKDNLTVFHWLFEGGETAPVADVLGDKGMRVRSDYNWTGLDYFVTGHCIAHSNCMWYLEFNSSSMDDEKMNLFIRGLCSSIEGHGHITSIDLYDNYLSSQSLVHLVDIPAHILQHVKKFNVSSNKLDQTGIDHIVKTIPHMPELEDLNLYDNRYIKRGGAVAVLLALCGHKALKVLNLYFTDIAEEDCEQLAALLSSSQSLEKVYVSHLSSDSVHILFNGLLQNSSLKRLYVHSSSFSPDDTSVLSSYLQDKEKCKLEEINLINCKIEPSSFVELARGLSHNCSVKTLRLSETRIEDEGATALGQAMTENKTIVDLDVHNCSITTTGGAALAASLLQNTTLKVLNILDNTLGEAVGTFTKVLQENKALKKLDIRGDTSFSQSDVTTLLNALTNNQTLEELWLPREFEVDTDKRVIWGY